MSTRLPTRRLVTEMMARSLPAFAPLEGRKPWYWFREPAATEWLDCAESRGTPLHHTVSLCHSAKERCFWVDVRSDLLPVFSSQYGGHALRRLTSLPNTRLRAQAVPMEQTWYAHDGTEAGAIATLERIGAELVAYAVPWFRENDRVLRDDPIACAARAWLLSHWASLPPDVGRQLEAAMELAGWRYAYTELPAYDDLRNELRRVADAWDLSLDDRQVISPLAYDALLYAGVRKQLGPPPAPPAGRQ